MTPQFQSPFSHKLVEYWHSLCVGKAIPTTERFLDHVPAVISPYLILFESNNDELIVRFAGTKLVERWAEDLTGKNWLAANLHLKASGILSNFRSMIRHPCGGHARGSFVSSVGRHLSIETVSAPLEVRLGRAPRIISGSFALETLGTDERSRGWMPPQQLDWIDLGHGIPDHPPAAAV